MKNNLRCGPRGNRRAGLLRAAPRAGLAALAAALCIGCTGAPEASPASSSTANNVTLTSAQREHIRLYTVAPSKFRNTVQAYGTVDFDNDQATSVLAPISGPVARLLVSLGDQVQKGAPLAQVDSADFAAAVAAYQKALATAKTDRRLADLDKDLLEHHGIAQREAAQAETDALNAESDRDAALQALQALNVPAQIIKDIEQGRPVSRNQALIRSPVAGTVVERLITPGQLLEAGTTPCFTVANLSRVWVMAQLFGSDQASVKLGDSAQILTGLGGQRLAGRVDNIASLVDPGTRAVLVRVVADNPGGVLKKQMYVRVLLQAREESSGLLIPVSAVLRDDENLPFVYLAQPDGSFTRQHVTLGHHTEEQYDIAAGLKAGDRIVVDGGIFVQFMQNQ